MVEVWKQLDGFDYDYRISNQGRVKRMEFSSFMKVNNCMRTYPTKELKLSKSGNGYLTFSAYKNKKKITQLIHKLVAKLFIENPQQLNCVCHKDDNKENNKVENLFWGSNLDNSGDMVNKGRSAKGENCGASKLTEEDVVIIKQRLTDGDLQKDIAIDFNVTRSCITSINNNKTWVHIQWGQE